MCNKNDGYIQKSLIKFAFLSRYKPIMWFNKLFNTFLIKYYCIIINTLHKISLQKTRKKSHLTHVRSLCIIVTSQCNIVTSLCIIVRSQCNIVTSLCINVTSLLIRETSLMIKVNAYWIILSSPITIVRSPLLNVNAHVCNVNAPLIIVFFRLINLYFHIKNKEEYLHIIHTLYKDEHKYWSESNYFT